MAFLLPLHTNLLSQTGMHYALLQLVYRRGSSRVEACIASPTSPLTSVNNSRLCSTHNHCSPLLCTECSTNDMIAYSRVKTDPCISARGVNCQHIGQLEATSLGRSSSSVVSCPAGNNLRKIRLVTLRAFLGLLHTSAGFKRGWRWPYMNVLTSTWLQLSLISITQALGRQWAAPVIGHTAI